MINRDHYCLARKREMPWLEIEQGWPISYSRSLTLPVPRSFLVTINSDPNGNGHGQSNAYVQSNDKAKG